MYNKEKADFKFSQTDHNGYNVDYYAFIDYGVMVGYCRNNSNHHAMPFDEVNHNFLFPIRETSNGLEIWVNNQVWTSGTDECSRAYADYKGDKVLLEDG